MNHTRSRSSIRLLAVEPVDPGTSWSGHHQRSFSLRLTGGGCEIRRARKGENRRGQEKATSSWVAAILGRKRKSEIVRADTVRRSVSCCGAAVAGNGGPGIQTVKSGLTLIVASRTRSLNGRYGDVFGDDFRSPFRKAILRELFVFSVLWELWLIVLNLYSVCELEKKKVTEEAKISVSQRQRLCLRFVDRFSTRTRNHLCTRPPELCD